MGITAGILTLGVGAVVAKQDRNRTKSDVAQAGRDVLAYQAATAPPVVPTPPDTGKQNIDAGIAMTNAAFAQRRKAAGAGGFASTILTSAQGAPPAVTQRKALLGV